MLETALGTPTHDNFMQWNSGGFFSFSSESKLTQADPLEFCNSLEICNFTNQILKICKILKYIA